jgi:hypothetical protein
MMRKAEVFMQGIKAGILEKIEKGRNIVKNPHFPSIRAHPCLSVAKINQTI